ncbi:MAG: DUF3147 family protein [Acidobacteriaceae bacterium]|jgi:hypothetical protein
MISVRLSSVKETKAHEYLLRFVFGGAATVLAGLVARYFGAGPGGLFLAFPAIFPAAATLMESHSKERMAKIGHDGTNRGRISASIDAASAGLGCVGLAGFALLVWRLLPAHNAVLIVFGATAVWAAVAVALWQVRVRRIFGVRMRWMR